MKIVIKTIVLTVLHAYYRVRMSRPVVLMLNLHAKRQFKRSKTLLSPVESLIVDEVRNNGYAVRSLVDFFAHDEILKIEAQALECRKVLLTDPKFERPADFVGKAFLRRISELNNRFILNDPLINFVVRGRANNIASHYLGQEVKISNIDYWLNLPSANGEGPTSSQKWHRDFEDRRVFKVFVYLTDVDDSSGPLSYLSGSQPGGRYESIFPTRPPLGVVVEEEQISGFVDSTELHTLRLPRLAIVFVDTAGLHKGGYCKSGLRFAFTATFTTFAGLSSKNFIIDGLGS